VSHTYPPPVPHLVVAALDDADLDAARAHLDTVTDTDLSVRLVMELSALAAPRPGTLTLGPAILVYGHPRRPGFAWRCGDCPWTGSNYEQWDDAEADARTHLGEHPAALRPQLVSLYPGESRHGHARPRR
jgi:hypothetical protein